MPGPPTGPAPAAGGSSGGSSSTAAAGGSGAGGSGSSRGGSASGSGSGSSRGGAIGSGSGGSGSSSSSAAAAASSWRPRRPQQPTPAECAPVPFLPQDNDSTFSVSSEVVAQLTRALRFLLKQPPEEFWAHGACARRRRLRLRDGRPQASYACTRDLRRLC